MLTVDAPEYETPSLDDLTPRQRDVLQAILENGPISYEDLAQKAGVSERTVANAVKALKSFGIKSTPAGYTAPAILKNAEEMQ